METKYPATRAEAKAQGAAYYFTGEPCKHGHTALRKTKGSCVECLKIQWQADNEARQEYRREYAARPEVKARQHEWYLRHRDEAIARAKTTPKAKRREYQAAWKRNNVEQVRADTSARRRRYRLSSPAWLTKEHRKQIREIYRTAMQLTETTSIVYTVDHIIPIRSRLVCGLHVPWNLQILPRDVNLAKSNSISEQDALAFPRGNGGA